MKKLKNVLKSCLLVAIMVTVAVSLYNSNIIYSDAKWRYKMGKKNKGLVNNPSLK